VRRVDYSLSRVLLACVAELSKVNNIGGHESIHSLANKSNLICLERLEESIDITRHVPRYYRQRWNLPDVTL